MGNASAATVAWMVMLTGTFAILAFTVLWAVTSVRPARARVPLTGRAAAPYWYSPTGRQDERGIVAVVPREPKA